MFKLLMTELLCYFAEKNVIKNHDRMLELAYDNNLDIDMDYEYILILLR